MLAFKEAEETIESLNQKVEVLRKPSIVLKLNLRISNLSMSVSMQLLSLLKRGEETLTRLLVNGKPR